MSDESKAAGGAGSGSTVKIVIAIVIFGIAGYFAYTNIFSSGSGEPPVTASENISEEMQETNEQIDEANENIPEEQIGGA